MPLCDYGCGQEAKYLLKFKTIPNKWCCSNHHSLCTKNIEKYKNCGSKNGFFGKHHTYNTKENISKKNKGKLPWNKGKKGIYTEETLDKIKSKMKGKNPWNKKGIMWPLTYYKEKYPLFFKIEEVRYNPNNSEEIQVRCKNHKCNNSKENDGWFTPTKLQFRERLRKIEEQNIDNNYFYCSDECKVECPVFNKRVTQLIREDKIKAGIIKQEYYTSEEYSTFRNEVLKRANYKCEYCGEKPEHVHHMKPQKLEPFFSLDPDYGISCCKKCHYEKGHRDECSTINIANEVCI